MEEERERKKNVFHVSDKNADKRINEMEMERNKRRKNDSDEKKNEKKNR